jgi:glycine cleavage system aminomethyltransferase T
VDLQVPDDVIGIEALRRIHAAGPRRHQLGVVLEGDEPTALGFHWHSILKNGQKVGDLTNCVWSYRLKKNIGFALIARTCAVGDRVDVVKEGLSLPGTLKELPFL